MAPTPDTLRGYPTLFIGTVTSIKGTVVTFRVDHWLKGGTARTVVLDSDTSRPEALTFIDGDQYIVAAEKDVVPCAARTASRPTKSPSSSSVQEVTAHPGYRSAPARRWPGMSSHRAAAVRAAGRKSAPGQDRGEQVVARGHAERVDQALQRGRGHRVPVAQPYGVVVGDGGPQEVPAGPVGRHMAQAAHGGVRGGPRHARQHREPLEQPAVAVVAEDAQRVQQHHRELFVPEGRRPDQLGGERVGRSTGRYGVAASRKAA
ncbi:hypothetical protein ACRAWF_20960 [Streptomyces sp. L7]